MKLSVRGREWCVSRIALTLCLVLVGLPCAAQVAGTASLNGTVMDTSGAVVSDAEVTATQQETNLVRTAKSSAQGAYLLSQLPPGTYRVEVKKGGFRTAVYPKVEVLIGSTATLDVSLQVGDLAQTVVVEATATPINTVDASLGNPLSGELIRSLPSLDLNPAGLLSLQAGVAYIPSQADTPGGYGGTSDLDGRSGAVNGARSDQTNITLDGVDCNDPVTGYAFTCVLRATQASLAEFRTTTTNYAADAGGRSGSAQVQLLTTSGENTLHGSAYYAHRNEAFNANDFFLNLGGVERPKFRRHLYGASLGGPLIKDRLFLFGNWERLEEAIAKSAVRNVPTLSFRDGVAIYECDVANDPLCPTSATTVTGRSGATYTVPAGSFGLSPAQITALDPQGIGPNDAILQYWSQYPTAVNDFSVGDGVNVAGHRFAAPISNVFNTYISKLDFNVDPAGRHVLFLRGTLQDDAVSQEPAFLGGDPIRTTVNGNRGLATGYTWLISPRLVNNFRYGYTRIKVENVGIQDSAFANIRFIDDLNGFDNPGLLPDTTLIRITPTHHFRDDVSWTVGNHTWSFGGEMRFTRNERSSNALSFHGFTVNPSWLIDGGESVVPGSDTCAQPICSTLPAATSNLQDRLTLMLGPITQVDASYNFNAQGETLLDGALVPRRFAVNEYEFYVQDQWRLFPSLTLTLGLRYQNATPPWETDGNQVIPVPENPALNGSFGAWFNCRNENRLAGRSTGECGLIQTVLGGAANDGEPYYGRDNNNWSPRIAAAWAPRFNGGILGALFGDGKMSIRGGYSLVYDRMGMALIDQFDQVGAFGLSTGITNDLGACDIGGPNPCVRWTGINDTAAAAAQNLQPSPGASFPAFPPSTTAVSNGLDDTIRSPYAHMIDFSISRELPAGITFEAAYVGRRARNLPLLRDYAMPSDICDPQSGMCAFEASRQLIAASAAGTALSDLGPIPFWENMFPAFGPSGSNGGCLVYEALGTGCGFSATQVAYDGIIFWHGQGNSPGFGESTFWQLVDFDQFPEFAAPGPFTFFPAQFVALNTWATIGRSEYHAFQLTGRKRMSHGSTFAVNYTLSKSLDHSSTPERQDTAVGAFNGAVTGIALNAWDPDLEYGISDFDMRHTLNAYWTWELPFGKGRRWGANAPGFLNAVIGGWDISSVLRFNSGLPASIDNGRTWPTNWNLTPAATCAPVGAAPLGLETGPCPSGRTTNFAPVPGAAPGTTNPNLFPDPEEAIRHFRFSATGERGQRNVIRGDGYGSIDVGFAKLFTMPYSEGHKLGFRWEIFNLTNTPYFDTASLNASLDDAGTFGSYTAVLGGPRRMQFAVKYEF